MTKQEIKTKMEITSITFFKNIGGDKSAYESIISINDKFVINVSGNENEALFSGVAHHSEYTHKNAIEQEYAFNNVDNDKLEKELESNGFENNIDWLEEHADVIL